MCEHYNLAMPLTQSVCHRASCFFKKILEISKKISKKKIVTRIISENTFSRYFFLWITVGEEVL